MLKTETAKTRAGKFRDAVRDFMELRGVTDREAVEEVAPVYGYAVTTGLRMFRGYDYYAPKKRNYKSCIAVPKGIP